MAGTSGEVTVSDEENTPLAERLQKLQRRQQHVEKQAPRGRQIDDQLQRDESDLEEETESAQQPQQFRSRVWRISYGGETGRIESNAVPVITKYTEIITKLQAENLKLHVRLVAEQERSAALVAELRAKPCPRCCLGWCCVGDEIEAPKNISHQQEELQQQEHLRQRQQQLEQQQQQELQQLQQQRRQQEQQNPLQQHQRRIESQQQQESRRRKRRRQRYRTYLKRRSQNYVDAATDIVMMLQAAAGRPIVPETPTTRSQ